MGKRDLRNKVAAIFELPGEVMLNQSRIALVGARELMIENHRGLVEYAEHRVALRVPEGVLCVEGAEMVIGSISTDQVTIQGKIRTIRYSD